MALEFPPDPGPGDLYLSYVFDGEKWSVQAGVGGVAGVSAFNTRVGPVTLELADVTGATGIGTEAQARLGLATVAASGAYADLSGTPTGSSTPPVMDGTATAGIGTTWARDDHRHPSDTSRAPIQGVSDGTEAGAGNRGEYLTASNSAGTTMTNNVTLNVATLALTPGDWHVWGTVIFVAGGTSSPTAFAAAVGTTNATLPTPAQLVAGNGSMSQVRGVTVASNQTQILQTGFDRTNVNVGVTYYLTAQTAFSGGNVTVTGFICARRLR